MVCTGDPIALGSSIRIRVYAAKGSALLTEGVFVVSAVGLSTPLVVTAAPGSTEAPFSASATPTYVFIPAPIPTTTVPAPVPGGSYPNP